MTVEDRCAELSARFGLPEGSAERFERLLAILAAEPASVTSVKDPHEAVEIHVADSLAGLLVPAVVQAARIADIGAGAGLPGLVLAAALPGAEVTLVESVGTKAAFIEAAAVDLGLGNVTVEAVRAEEVRGLGGYDVVTARALGSLPLVLEYAAPLLRPGGTVVAWKGARDEAETAAGSAAAVELGLSDPRWLAVEPGLVRGAQSRHLVVCEKIGLTPERYPRRPGMARKRPLGPRP